jgi:superfamily I DNA/RNA helicase
MLSNLQQQIVDNDENIIFVEAAAASGKTATIVEKIKRELAADNGKVVAFTFTNAAAEEMYDRVGEQDRSKLFIGTIHSYCVQILLAYGIDEAIQYCEEQWFDRLFQLVKKHRGCAKPVYCIICDEMQDCNESQFEFIFDILSAEKYFCCYDKRQSIYRWNGAHPEFIDDYAEKMNAEILTLNENYRNSNRVLNFAKNIIAVAGWDYRDDSIPMRGVTGVVKSDIEYSPHAVARSLASLKGGYGNWFVLTRTNDQIDEIVHHLKLHNVPFDTFKRAELNNKELNERMKADTVKVLTIHSAKGLEADNVIVIGPKFYNLEERCISYVAATRARNNLYWTKMPNKTRKQNMVSNWES